MQKALLLTTLAGLSTALGGILAVIQKPTKKIISACMGFAAGIMLTISFADMLPEAIDYYRNTFSVLSTTVVVTSLLLMGMILAGIIEWCIPEETATQCLQSKSASHLVHSALVMSSALILHNLPEGILTLFAGIANPQLGIRLTIAVALHNLPEGMIVAAPLYYATNQRKKAIGIAFLSGIAEPIGALLAFLFLGKFLTPGFLNGLMVLVSGVMIWLSVVELIPTAWSTYRGKTVLEGAALGVFIMLLGIRILS